MSTVHGGFNVTHEGRTLGGQRGKIPLGVLVLVAVVAIVAVFTAVKVAGRRPASTEYTDDTASVLTELAPQSPLVIVANQLSELIDSSEAEAGEIPELTADMPNDEARRTRERWDAWSQQFRERLEAIAVLLPEPPPEDAETPLKRGYDRLPRAIDELRGLVQSAADDGVPTMLKRTRHFGIARNHVASAQRYFFRVGL
jgi:hypothetical protein